MFKRKHARLSASSAHRWMECSASVSLEEQSPEQGSNATFLVEGITAHYLAEICLRTGEDTWMHIDEQYTFDGLSFTVNEEMSRMVQSYLEYIRTKPGTLLIEKRVDFSQWVPDGFGTSDAIILSTGLAIIADLKFGQGIKLFAEKNAQLMVYALGVLNEYGTSFDISTFRLSIIQPRLDHTSEWEISRADLLEWAEKTLQPAAKYALSKDPVARPGDRQCRFCRARGACRALAEFNMQTVVQGRIIDDGNIQSAVSSFLTDAEIVSLLPKLNMLVRWVDAFKDFVISEMEKGRNFPGYHLSTGRSIRKWSDENKARIALLGQLSIDDVLVKKVISPAQAEKKLGKNNSIVTLFSVRQKGKPVIVKSLN